MKCHAVAPCCFVLQMMQRAVMLAAESLKVLESQLKDGSQIQDVKVGSKRPAKRPLHRTQLVPKELNVRDALLG